MNKKDPKNLDKKVEDEYKYRIRVKENGDPIYEDNHGSWKVYNPEKYQNPDWSLDKE